MRAFGIAVLTAVLLGLGFWLVMQPAQQSTAVAQSTSSVRLSLPEVDRFGREAG